MRLIGQLESEQQAHRLTAYLYSRGIDSQMDPGKEGRWEIWVLDDDHIQTAQRHFERFQQNPDADEFLAGAKTGVQQLKKDEKEATPKRAHVIDGRTAVQRPVIGLGPVTIVLIFISVAVSINTGLKLNHGIGPWLTISNHMSKSLQGLVEIQQGQIWRLFTPMFLHLGILHILFNMLWLKDLGAIVETFKGSWYLLALVLVIAAISNVGQLMVGGPTFGGMSGVIYGLLGYLWMLGKFNPASPIRLNPQIVQFMIIWFFACLIGIIPNVANAAHGVGLVVGMAWGYLEAQWARRR